MRSGYMALLLVLLLNFPARSQTSSFNADSAYAYTEYLSKTIGPRPIGSDNEQKARQWAAEKLRMFGADTVYQLSIDRYGKRGNTRSGVTTGVFEGQSDTIIVIGAHIDSSSPFVAGANDNASGAASTLELARLWGKESPRLYTLVFALFGGEEQGLIGSKHFVEHFPDIEKVKLMLNIDMAGSPGWLIPFIDTKTHQAPRQLVEDAYALDKTLGYGALEYPTHFFSLNSSIGGAGSDHLPFMDKDIAAIDFTAGINTSPIHTPQDKLVFISKPMLARSGNLVDGLIRKYQQQGIPARAKDHYMLWQIGNSPVFISRTWMIIILVLSVLIGLGGILQVRKTRLTAPEQARPRFSGLKLLLFLIILAVSFQVGEILLGLVKGMRYPWLAHIENYLTYSVLWLLAGVWLIARLTRKIKLNPDPAGYAIRAYVLLLLFTAALGFGSVRLALYPALTMVILFLLINVAGSLPKIILALAAAWPLSRLVFNEAFAFMARSSSLAGFQMQSFYAEVIYTSILTLALVIWFAPVFLIFIYTSLAVPPLKTVLLKLRSSLAGGLIALLLAGYGGYLYGLPAYDDFWNPIIRVEAKQDLRNGEKSLLVSSNDYLRSLHIRAADFRKEYRGGVSQDSLPISFEAPWAQIGPVQAQLLKSDSAALTYQVEWQMVARRPWQRVSATVEADTLTLTDFRSEWNYSLSDGKAGMTWFADPPDTIIVAGEVTLPGSAKLIRDITVRYTDLPVELEVESDLAPVTYRTTLTFRDTVLLAARPDSL